MPKMLMTLLLGVMMIAGSPAFAETVDFEDLTLSPDSYYNGDDNAGGFESGGAEFNNYYSETEYGGIIYIYWEGFAFSNTTDTTTLDYDTNQYSAIPGSGSDGSANYGVSFFGFYDIPTIRFEKEVIVSKADITNTTYAFLTMRQGYQGAKKFGGASGGDPDWFLLTVTGKDEEGKETGTVEFYLADFRFTDNDKDYIVEKWTSVDFSGLGPVKSLEFSLSSSDYNEGGMLTPGYFAIDNIVFSDADDSSDSSSLGCFITNLQ